eukprot:764581-Hanusia_phi.AAC.1
MHEVLAGTVVRIPQVGWELHVRAVRCRAVRCRAVRCRVVPCGAVRCRAVRCRAVRCRAVRRRHAPPHVLHHASHKVPLVPVAPHELVDSEVHVHCTLQVPLQQRHRRLAQAADHGSARLVVGHHRLQQRHGVVLGSVHPTLTLATLTLASLVRALACREQRTHHRARRHVRAEHAPQALLREVARHRVAVNRRRQVHQRHAQLLVHQEVAPYHLLHRHALLPTLQAAVHAVIDPCRVVVVPRGRYEQVPHAGRLVRHEVVPHHLHPGGAHAVVAQRGVRVDPQRLALGRVPVHALHLVEEQRQRHRTGAHPAAQHRHTLVLYGDVARARIPRARIPREIHRVQLHQRCEEARQLVRCRRQRPLHVHEAHALPHATVRQVPEVARHPPPAVLHRHHRRVRPQPLRRVVPLRTEGRAGPCRAVRLPVTQAVVVLVQRAHLPPSIPVRPPQAVCHVERGAVLHLPLVLPPCRRPGDARHHRVVQQVPARTAPHVRLLRRITVALLPCAIPELLHLALPPVGPLLHHRIPPVLPLPVEQVVVVLQPLLLVLLPCLPVLPRTVLLIIHTPLVGH